MARRTLQQEIDALETRRDNLETKLAEHESYKSIEGQGSQGAKTEFTDPLKLQEMLDKVNAKLATLYRSKGL